jgi:serine/threonine-protein kinase
MEPGANLVRSNASELSSAEILAQLERILASKPFINSERLRRFLRIAVERALAGETETLKEYAIGRDVFDRDDQYDPRVDSIVRVEARRLRSKLQLYYGKQGAGDPVRIVIQRGSYVPAFRRAEPPAMAGAPAAAAANLDLDRRAVAVLPFFNLSGEPDQEYFGDGITDEIINKLAGIPGLKVIAHTSVFHFRQPTGDVREIGRKLGVGTIIEGSVRRSGGQLRISASVVDAATGHRLRTASFDREMDQVFAIQDEIARDIAGSLEVTLRQPERRPLSQAAGDDVEAYGLLLHARYLLNKLTPAGYRSAMEVLGRAISRYPAYAPYYPVLSEALSRFYLWGLMSPQEAIPPAKAAALEGLRLDDGLAEAHVALGGVLVHHDWAWEESARLLRHALELQPSNVQAHIYLAVERLIRGHRQDGIQLLQTAIRLDPISLNANRALAVAYYYSRQYEQAAEWIARTLEIDPDFREAHYFMGQILLRKGAYAEAEAEFRKIADQPAAWTKLGAIAETYARAGRIEEARELLAEWNSYAALQYVPPLSCVPVYIALEDWDAVFAWLERAYEDRSAWFIFVGSDPLYDAVRSDRRFRSLLRRMRLA